MFFPVFTVCYARCENTALWGCVEAALQFQRVTDDHVDSLTALEHQIHQQIAFLAGQLELAILVVHR